MEDSRLNCLPAENKLNIFSRLQAELVLDCKRVCRVWRDFIRLHANTVYFANLHLQCQHGDGLIHQNPHWPSPNGFDSSMTTSFISCFDGKDLYYAEYYDGNNSRKEYYKTKRISHKFPISEVQLVGSCNGLICCKRGYNKFSGYMYQDCEPLYIYNPIIGEIVNIPGKNSNDKPSVHGFGYHPLTNEYKVVRISYDEYEGENKPPYTVDVYTLGSSSGWRSKGETKYRLLPNCGAGSVCVNGALHWLQEGSEDIVAFDLADEEFHLLQSPPDQQPFNRRLQVFRGCLVLVNAFFAHVEKPTWHLWFLKTNKEANSSYNIKEFYTNHTRWSKEYTTNVRCNRMFSVLDGGQALLMDKPRGDISRYSLVSQNFTVIWRVSDETSYYWAVPIPHINSFVSLKALGEKNVGSLTAEGELKFPSSVQVAQATTSGNVWF